MTIDLDKEINLPLCENFREGEHVEGHPSLGRKGLINGKSLSLQHHRVLYLRFSDITIAQHHPTVCSHRSPHPLPKNQKSCRYFLWSRRWRPCCCHPPPSTHPSPSPIRHPRRHGRRWPPIVRRSRRITGRGRIVVGPPPPPSPRRRC